MCAPTMVIGVVAEVPVNLQIVEVCVHEWVNAAQVTSVRAALEMMPLVVVWIQVDACPPVEDV
jgi:hypothetical protein